MSPGEGRGRERDFGPYGGRFVPETLVPGARRAGGGLARGARRPRLRRGAGRARCATTPAARRRSTSRRGCPRRWAARSTSSARTCCTPAPTRSTTPSARRCWRRRMGKRRVIAETGAGQHGVAAATACALLGLECVVYMGSEDMRRQRPNVERMGLLGAEVAPVEAGARTLKEAVSAAIRDWVANVATTHYVIGSAVGPGALPGARARPPARDRRRDPRAGPGRRGPAARPRDRLRGRRLERDRRVRAVRARRAASS